MDYKEQAALVSRINNESITVLVPCESSEKCKACSSFGSCGSGGSSLSYTVPTDHPENFKKIDSVTLKRAVPPFSVSVFFVFILPLLLMILFPILLYYGSGGQADGELETVIAGAAGLVIGVLPGRIIDRKFSSKYPPEIK